jgi:chemotaxis protein CheD
MMHTVLPTLPMGFDGPATHHVLHPGDVVCAGLGNQLETLLGSCVAVLLTDPRHTVGSMCHIVHPAGDIDGETTFAAAALRRMQDLLMARGITPRLCQAWVCGGGNMFPGRYAHGHVGDANARWVLQALDHDGVQVVGQDLGGPRYRRVRWTVGDAAPSVTAVHRDT